MRTWQIVQVLKRVLSLPNKEKRTKSLVILSSKSKFLTYNFQLLCYTANFTINID